MSWLHHLLGEPHDPRPAHVIDAELHPRLYFTCDGCGEGPWHFAWSDYIDDPNGTGKRIRLGGCCSGAD